MQAIRQRYNSLSVCFYNLYRSYVTNCPLTIYGSYAFRMAETHFPKLSYQNNFEPAYTRNTVKYNVPIVLSLIAVTVWASHQAVVEEENQNVHRT